MAQRGRQGESPRRPSGSRTLSPQHGSSASSPPFLSSVSPFPPPLPHGPRASHRRRARATRARNASEIRPRRGHPPHRLCCSLARSARFFLPPFSLGDRLARSLRQLAIPQSKHIPFSLLPPSASALAAAAAGTLLAPLPPPRQVKPRAPWLLVDRESPPPVCRRAAAGRCGWRWCGSGVRVRVAGRLIFCSRVGGTSRSDDELVSVWSREVMFSSGS